MKNHRAVYGLVAALLAVLLPLEQAHCAWMNLQPLAASSGCSGHSDHSCCSSSTATQHRAPALPECCVKLPPAALASDFAFPSHPLTPSLFAALATVVATPTLGHTWAPAPALDIGSPPLPIDLGAHGLRAPPLSA